MEQDARISHTQLMALIWAGVLAPAAEVLPGIALSRAGRAAWLTPIAAVLPVLAAGWLLKRLIGPQGLAGGIRSVLGPVGGSVVLMLYAIWGELLLALRFRLCAGRLLGSGERDGSLYFFLALNVLAALWVGTGKLTAFARAGQVYLAILLVTAGLVLALSVPQVRLERVLPFTPDQLRTIPVSALPVAGVLGWGVYGAFLAGESRSPQGRWWSLFWGAGGCLLLALAQWIILGSFGAGLAERLENPFFALAKSVGVEGAFQRVESIVAALWILADLTMAELLIFALREIVGAWFPGLRRDRIATGAVALAAVLAVVAFPGRTAAWLSREAAPWGNLAASILAPGLVILRKPKGRDLPGCATSCGESTAPAEDVGGDRKGEKCPKKLQKPEKTC